MKHSLRGTQKPIPDNLHEYLSEIQQLGLCQAEEYGWHLEFVRRSKSRDTLTVLMVGDESMRGILQKDGCINIRSNFPLRH